MRSFICRSGVFCVLFLLLTVNAQAKIKTFVKVVRIKGSTKKVIPGVGQLDVKLKLSFYQGEGEPLTDKRLSKHIDEAIGDILEDLKKPSTKPL